jgi:hypothetical protein
MRESMRVYLGVLKEVLELALAPAIQLAVHAVALVTYDCLLVVRTDLACMRL